MYNNHILTIFNLGGLTAMKEMTFTSTDKQTPLHVCVWDFVKEPKGVVQLIHGMTEYVERYAYFAQYLNKLGFIVVGHDHLGHGSSVDPNEPTYGFFGENGVANVLADIDQVKQWAQKHYPELPYFMLGHSMGSFALRTYLQVYPVDIQGVILMGTGTQPKTLDLAFPVIKQMAKIKPKTAGTVIDKMAFSSYNKRFEEPSPFSWLSKNPENLRRYAADPKLGFTFTFNGFETLFSLVKYANQKNWMAPIPQTLSILIISGAEDPVGDFGKGPKKIARDLEKNGFEDITLALFDTLRHEILLEKEFQEVVDRIEEWLMNHI